MSFILHKGAKEVTREQLCSAFMPEPTPTHQPIPHCDLIDLTLATLDRAGFRVKEQKYGLTPDQMRFFGVMELETPGAPRTYKQVLGIRNAHDKRFSAGLVLGNRVMVCDNLSFSGEIQIARKHTRWILRDLEGMVSDAISRLRPAFDQQSRRVTAYQNRELEPAELHDLAIRALDRGAYSSSKIGKILDAYREPKHEEFEPRTVWSYFNAVTEVAKGTNIETLPARTIALHAACDEFALV